MTRAFLGSVLAVALLVGWALLVSAQESDRDRRSQVKGGRDYLPSLDTERVDTLAWVGGVPITRQSLEARLDELAPDARTQFKSPEGRKQLLDRMIEEQVWLYEAEQAEVGERPDIQARLEQARRNLLIRTYLQEVMQSMPAPSDSAIQAYFEEHQSEPQYRSREAAVIRHIQVETESEAEEAMSRLERGEDFDQLVERLSTDETTKENGGKLGRIERGGPFGPLGRQTALSESAFAAPVGKPKGPVESTIAWHVLVVDEKFPSEPLPVERVRPQISSILSRQLQEDFYKQQLASAEEDAGVRRNQAAIDSLLFGSKPAPELFREAQSATTADERLAGYQLVVGRYPESEFAPQALFMIGFIYSEEKKDYDSAEASFRTLLADYPDSELAGSARWMLENMRTETVPEFDPASGDTLPLPKAPSSPDG
jgi:peptidyl-prolyl cis-trans isomerase C